MTTTYAGSIDKSEVGGQQGIRFAATLGSGGCTYGQPLKINTTAKEVVASTTTSDIIVGIAATTGSETDQVKVLGDGCLVLVPYTLTTGSKVGVGTSGTAGTLIDYSSGTVVGVTIAGATLASVIRIQIQY